MNRAVSALLALVIMLCPACAPEPEPVRKVDKIESLRTMIKSVVGIRRDGRWGASGVIVKRIVKNGRAELIILTARHVVNYGGQFEIMLYDGADYITDIVPAEVLAIHDTKDLAIMRATWDWPVVATMTDWKPWPLEIAATVGASIKNEIVAHLGTVSAWLEEEGLVLTTCHAQWGYSGGAMFVWRDDHWELVGIVVNGVAMNGVMLFHQTLVVPVRDSLDWIAANVAAYVEPHEPAEDSGAADDPGAEPVTEGSVQGDGDQAEAQ